MAKALSARPTVTSVVAHLSRAAAARRGRGAARRSARAAPGRPPRSTPRDPSPRPAAPHLRPPPTQHIYLFINHHPRPSES